MSEIYHDYRVAPRVVAVRSDGKGLGLRPHSVSVETAAAAGNINVTAPPEAVAMYACSGGAGNVRISIGANSPAPSDTAGIQLAAQVNCPIVVNPGEPVRVRFSATGGVITIHWLMAV